jgi:excinuclease UvrABC helicase subunit UvrB
MKKSEFLKRAWSRIDRPSKWIQNAFYDGADRYCMVGAMQAEARRLRITSETAPAEISALFEDVRHDLEAQVHSGSCYGIEDYNDSHNWHELRATVMQLLGNYEQRERVELSVQESPVPADFTPQQPKVVHVKAKPTKTAQAEKEMA